MGKQVVVYPRLYSTYVPGDSKADPINSLGDESVTELFRVYESGVIPINNMDFKLCVMDCAVRLFGDFHAWMLLQRNNPNLLGHNVGFLADCVKYITTGKRDLAPLTWLGLVSERSAHTTMAHHQTLPELGVSKDVDTAQVIQLWCSRPHGFEDLAVSLFLFFGHSLVGEEAE